MVFNMTNYFSIDQTPVEEFDVWIGVLNLATMWDFQEVQNFSYVLSYYNNKMVYIDSRESHFPSFRPY